MQTIKSFSVIADLLRAKAKQRSDDDEAEPQTDDDEKRDDVAEDRRPRKKKRAQPDENKDLPKEEDEPGESGSSALTPAQVTSLAEQVVNAGRQRRGEIPIENPAPIVSESARYAGTATYVTPVEDPAAMAAAIVAAGKRRRGEAT